MKAIILWAFLILGPAGSLYSQGEDSYNNWSLPKAVQILNSSSWARQETFTTVVQGVGSGQSGEKEIYNRFYVRFLSAAPVREAYARVLQIDYGYDEMDAEGKRRIQGNLSQHESA